MAVSLGFGSNNDTLDLTSLPLEDLPALGVTELHLNIGHARDIGEPNTHARLCAVNFFARMRAVGLRGIYEAPALKNWREADTCVGDDEIMRDQMREADVNVRKAGGVIYAFEYDEPLTAYPTCPGMTVDDCIGITSTAIREMDAIGIRSRVIEAYPHNPIDRIVQFVEQLNPRPDRFVFDIDANAFPKAPWWAPWRRVGFDDPKIQRELRLACQVFHALGIETEIVIQIGHEQPTDAAYRDAVLAFNAGVRKVWNASYIDVVTVRSWAGERGTQVQPLNLPVNEPASHLGILQTVAQEWS